MKKPKDWQLLDSLKVLPYVPEEMFIVNCFYCILKEGDEYYIPLVYPSYKYDDQKKMIVGGTWTPPYTAITISEDFCQSDGAKNPRLVREEFGRYILHECEKIEKSIESFFDYIGIRGAKIAEEPFIDYQGIPRDKIVKKPFLEFIEYKTAVHSDKFSCYYIRNFYVTDIDKRGQINLMDPDSLRGIHFLNLKEVETMSFDKDKNFLYYKGRPMATNLTYILKEDKLDKHDKRYLNDIVSTEKVYDETGYIFMYDINSSGEIRQFIEDNYKSLHQSGKDIADTFLNIITKIFTEVLIKNNIKQYQLTGDGFIASIPEENEHKHLDDDDDDSINIIRGICVSVHKEIRQCLEKLKIPISAKVTICKGNYTYGKVGGLTSAYSSYVGEILFDLDRRQSALSSYIKSECSKLSSDSELYFTFNTEDNVNKKKFTKLDSFTKQVKEKQLTINIYVLPKRKRLFQILCRVCPKI